MLNVVNISISSSSYVLLKEVKARNDHDDVRTDISVEQRESRRRRGNSTPYFLTNTTLFHCTTLECITKSSVARLCAPFSSTEHGKPHSDTPQLSFAASTPKNTLRSCNRGQGSEGFYRFNIPKA